MTEDELIKLIVTAASHIFTRGWQYGPSTISPEEAVNVAFTMYSTTVRKLKAKP